MAITFNIHLGKQGKQGRRVYIRCTYQRKAKDLPTQMYIAPDEVTKGGRIKNAQVTDKCHELITQYRKRAYNAGADGNATAAELFAALADGNGQGVIPSFSEYAKEWLERSTRRGTDNYRTALRAFHSFLGSDNIRAEEVNASTMEAFSASLADRPRARSLYTSAVAKIFNDMREDTYNDATDEYAIRNTLRRFRCPRQVFGKTKRALALDDVRRLLSLALGVEVGGVSVEHSGSVVKNLDNSAAVPMSSRARLAVDCWALSFCLMGINSVDLYELAASQYDGETVTYSRHKTRGRRGGDVLTARAWSSRCRLCCVR